MKGTLATMALVVAFTSRHRRSKGVPRASDMRTARREYWYSAAAFVTSAGGKKLMKAAVILPVWGKGQEVLP